MEPINTEQNEIQLEVGEMSAVEANPKKDVNYVLPAAILIAAVLISGSILYSKDASVAGGAASNTGAVAAATPSVENLKEIRKDEYVRGSRKADIIIVEFSDTECPFCKVFHQTMQRLMQEYGQNGKLAWVYRHFPLDSLHKKARAEAEAMECAGLVGGGDAFWRFADEVFARTNSNDSLDSAELPKIAAQIGLDQADWNACVLNRLTKEKIEADTADATASGARGTPYSVLINTKTGEKTVILGAQPYEVLKQNIETALAGQ
jgi:protein-disulfide isomerase